MDKDYQLYENLDQMDQSLPIIFHRNYFSKRSGKVHFSCHWHEKIELLYITKGELLVKCNSLELSAIKGDLIVVNSNELHQGYCISEEAAYYCIIFDTSLLQSGHIDACQTKYINPLDQNRIIFKNKIQNDKMVAKCIYSFVKEYEQKETGFEMAVKASLYQLLVLLLRKHVQVVLTSREYDLRMKQLDRFNIVLKYIENNYNEKITIDQLCKMVNMSRFHFCKVFKSLVGKSLGDYLNSLRINKAESMLRGSTMNITEVAMTCGFDDMNYFSRVFKKYKKVSPSSALKMKEI